MGQIQLRDITPWNEEFPGEYQMYLDLFLYAIHLIVQYLYLNTCIKNNIGLKIDVLFCTNKLCVVEENYGKMKYNYMNKNIIII